MVHARQQHPPDTAATARGFTLIELLVVVTVIVVLVAMMMPALQSARLISEDAVCRSQMHQVGVALVSFSADHAGNMPGNWWWSYCAPATDPEGGPYFGKEVDSGGITGWGHTGTLAAYIGVKPGAFTKLYRCPSVPVAPLGSGQGSNGMFDYSCPLMWAGSRLTSIPGISWIRNPNTNVTSTASTVLFDEEDAVACINTSNIEMGFGNLDQLAVPHPGFSTNYVATDGGVVHTIFGGRGPNCWDMSGRAPSGAILTYGNGFLYQGWQRQ